MNTLAVKVVKKTREADDIVSFEFASADGRPLPPFSAGSHIDVHVGQGLVRQYSLCNDPQDTHRYQIAVLKDPRSRGGSVAVHDTIAEGDVVQIGAPRNHFPLVPAGHYLLLAGGIGVTPILCMAERLARTGAAFDMHYCTRAPERTAFVARIAGSSFADRVRFHFDSEEGGRIDLQAVLDAAPPDTHVYVCGPGGFIDFVTAMARARGWPDERVHFEYFGAAPADTSGDRAFEVKIASSGAVYTIPADQPVTLALQRHGIDIMVSCEQGVCGTCVTRVLEGEPEHRDVYLTDEEKAANDQFTPCCSRARSACLVLDL
ncbi:PDR/VanB family oxidoreductase [uncultured Massilia sp.]|uniref:PDR/VanB family oxidoreductase n=1 Tax=uncultured Massilia sp. TaxID=169973 RepID=UPI0025CD8E25|nr:PDR/VanB family oxidoreductase [uncultured Massilia sp.]